MLRSVLSVIAGFAAIVVLVMISTILLARTMLGTRGREDMMKMKPTLPFTWASLVSSVHSRLRLSAASLRRALRASARGMLATIEDSSAPEGPQRSIFQLTAAGHEEFLRLLRQAIRTADLNSQPSGRSLSSRTVQAQVQPPSHVP